MKVPSHNLVSLRPKVGTWQRMVCSTTVGSVCLCIHVQVPLQDTQRSMYEHAEFN